MALTHKAESPADAPTPSAGNKDISLTPGKMEVVVKLNQLPDDVRTVDLGKLEFVVDTGEALVTITVKPKVFAALEQAQLDYPEWVATISGQMGERTLTGFRLESAQIKVFERKAKSEPEQTMLKDNAQKATETPPSPPAKMQLQQQAAPVAESPAITLSKLAHPCVELSVGVTIAALLTGGHACLLGGYSPQQHSQV